MRRLLTVPVRLSRCSVVKLWISYHFYNSLQTALISTRWTMQSGASCSCASTACESVTSTTSFGDSWRSSPDLTTRSSVLQLLSSEVVGMCVCEGGMRTFRTLFKTMNEHTASSEITERVAGVVTETFQRVIENT